MKRFFLTIAVILGGVGLYAQNAQTTASDTLKMSLQDCINYALKNNTNVKNATLDEEIAEARVREVRGIGLPQISGSVALQHYFKLRNNYFSSNNSFLSSYTAQDPSFKFPADEIIVSNNIFQLPSTLDASVTASQILFNASYLVGLQAANTYKSLSQKSAKQTNEQTVNGVKKAYYQQLVNLERIQLYDININRIDSTLKQTKALQQNGFAETIDVYRLEVSYNNLLTEYEKTLNLLLLSSLQLKFQMSMDLEQNLILTDSLGRFVADTSYASQEVNYKNRTDYQLLELQKKSNQLEIKNNRAAGMPSVVLSGTLGAFTSNSNMNFFSEKAYTIGGTATAIQLNSHSIFSDYAFIQAGLNVPIFSGLQRSSKVQQSKLSLRKTENTIKNFEKTANMQIYAAKINLANSYKTLGIQNRNLGLAKEVSNIAAKRYKAGTGSNLEVTNAEAALKEAQVNYFGALYDYLVFKVDYEQAAGLNSKY